MIINSAIASGLDVIGDRWSLLILRDAFLNRTRFEQFRRHTGISKASLSRRLDTLITQDILYKHAYSSAATRFEYKLTEKGLGLFASSLLCWQWELEWGSAKAERIENQLPYQLVHKSCEQILRTQAVCRHCQQTCTLEHVQLVTPQNDSASQLDKITSLNKHRRVRSSVSRGDEDLALANISDLIGDRWTLLLLIAAFFGVKRYDMFVKRLNIASNILTTRLNLLVQVEVLERCNYQQNPPRYEYRLSQKGKSLYPIVMAMRQWIVDWQPQTPAPALLHKTCGKPLAVDVQCCHCQQVPSLRDVRFIESD